MLQKHLKNLKHSNEELQNKCKAHEHYSRRLCLRKESLTKKTKEDANVILNQVCDLSKENNDAMVRFTTFRHRTLFYRNRKKLKNKSIHLDLTKSRLSLLNEARKLIENNEDIAFCYADINCRCKLRFKNNNDFFFESLDVLKSKLSGYSKDSNE